MLIDNVRHAYRNLRSAPGFAATSILSLGIGIGGSVAMFTLVNSIVLKPLAYSEAGRLVLVTNLTPKIAQVPVHGLVPLQFIRWRKEIQSFESFAVSARAMSMNLTGSGQPERLGVMRVTSSFFDTLRIKPERGRWFRQAEETRGTPNVAVISDSLWRRRLSARPDVIGSKILLNDVVYEIVGITPPDMRLFRGRQLNVDVDMPDRADVFLPIRFTEDDEQGGFHPSYIGIARLKPGVTVEQARAELDSSLASFRAPAFLAAMDTHIGVQPLKTALVGSIRRSLLLLLFSVSLVLLIACLNVANLSFVRAARRSRELAIRIALGAGRRNLIGLLLTESSLLALGGTAIGWMLSLWITELAISRAPAQAPRLEETAVDATVLLFAVAVCAATALICGLLPAWRALRIDPQQGLSSGTRSSTEPLQAARLRSLLVGAEVALGTMLVIASSLLLTSLHRVMNVQRGFEAEDILTADLLLPSPRYQEAEKQISFFRAVHDALAATPGVRTVAVNSIVPLGLETTDAALQEDRGLVCSNKDGCRGTSGQKHLPLVAWPRVTSEYFHAMRIPLRAGRLFRDEGETEPVAILSESAARLLWPGEDALGKRLSKPVSEDPGVYWLVVGIIGDVHSGGLDRAPTPAVYRPYMQTGGASFSLVVHAAIAPGALAKTVREAIARVDSNIPIPEMHTMPEIVNESVQQRRFQAILLSAFAFLAVALAAIGIHGVVAQSIVQRRKEIGVRLALGAGPRQLRRLVLRIGMAPVLAGLAVGLCLAAFAGRFIAALLFDVSPFDPLVFISSSLVLGAAAAIPCWINARHATRIDPMVALRFD